MDNIIIGIPGGLLYYKYKTLYHTFFNELNIKYLVSKNNKENNLSLSEVCSPVKEYIGFINDLKDRADLIIIPVSNIKKCKYFKGIYDISNNIFSTNIIDMNMNSEEESFLKLGKKLGFGKESILNAYKKAKIEEYKQNKIDYLFQERKIMSKNKKILLIADDYLLNNSLNSKLKKLKEKNIDLLYLNIFNPDDKNEEKQVLNNFIHLSKYVSGIMIISTSPCMKKTDIFYKNDVPRLIININNLEDIKKIDKFIDEVLKNE